MKREEILSRLFELQDEDYKEMQYRIIPSLDEERIIGVRTPALRRLAKEIEKDEDTALFLEDLPHEYFDENQLHAFLICLEKDFDVCLKQVETFLPYIDNWATCDQLSPKVFKKNKEKLLPHIYEWIASDRFFTIRFGIGMLMQHFLDEDFKIEYAELVAPIYSDDYYVNMMIAWYFATALAKQYEKVLPILEESRMMPWAQNMTIQKCVESKRVPEEHKAYLRTLKRSY